MNISILCVYNDNDKMNDFVSNLKTQKINEGYQLIPIDNIGNTYHSIREAYNANLDKIENDIVVFIHQDIRFLKENVLQNFIEKIREINDFGVVGIAGCKNGVQWKLLTNIIHGADRKNAGELIRNTTEVQTVDECCFVMHLSDLQSIGFSELNGWHIYAVEQCLRMSEIGKKNYVVPVEDIWHMSDGRSLDPSYVVTLEQVKKYCQNIDYLNTTVRQWKVHGLFPYLYRKYYYVKQVIKHLIIHS